MKKLIILLAVLFITIQLFGWGSWGQSRGTSFTQRWIELTDSLKLVNTITEFSTDGTLAGNSDDAVPTEKAVKAYVDGAAGTVIWSRTGTTISPTNAGDDIDGTGNYLLDSQSITNLASKGAGYYLDGTGDYIELDDLATELVNTNNTKGTIVWNGRIYDLTADNVLWGFSDLSADETIVCRMDNTAGALRFICKVAGVEQWDFDTDNVVVEVNKEISIILVQDGTSPKVYINGIEVATDVSGDPDVTSWFHETTGVDSGKLGAYQAAGAGLLRELNCTINQFYAFNTALTATEVKDLYSGKELPYKYVGASQTEVTMSSFTNTTNCVENSGEITFVNDGLDSYALKSGVLEIGKRYRFDYEITGYTSGGILFLSAPSNPLLDMGVTTHSLEFTADQEAFGINSTPTTSAMVIDNMTITQIGNVANYSSAGVGQYSWMDNSGNGLHGTVSGAIPTNLKIGDRRTAYLSTTSTSPTMTDVIPAGWKVNTISIETAQNLTDIDAVQETSTIALIENKTLNNGLFVWRVADHNLYVTDKDIVFTLTGNGGDGAKIYVELEKVK